MARPRVLIVTEVPASRTEGSERLITDVMEVLTAQGRAVTRTVPLTKWARWSAPLQSGGEERPLLVHFYPIGSLTAGALVRAWLWRRHSETRSVLLHAFQTFRGDLRVPRWVLRTCLGSRGGVVSQSWRLTNALQAKGIPVFFVPPAVNPKEFRPPRPAERKAAPPAESQPGDVVSAA
jgi:hypothetical protein